MKVTRVDFVKVRVEDGDFCVAVETETDRNFFYVKVDYGTFAVHLEELPALERALKEVKKLIG